MLAAESSLSAPGFLVSLRGEVQGVSLSPRRDQLLGGLFKESDERTRFRRFNARKTVSIWSNAILSSVAYLSAKKDSAADRGSGLLKNRTKSSSSCIKYY